MKMIDPLDVSQMSTEVVGRPLYILGSEIGSLTDSEKVRKSLFIIRMDSPFAFSIHSHRKCLLQTKPQTIKYKVSYFSKNKTVYISKSIIS